MVDVNTHLLIQAEGGYVSGAGTEEIWAVTLRSALVAGTVSPVGTFPTNLSVNANAVDRTEAAWTIVGNFQIASGGIFFNVDDWLNDQVAPAFVTWLGAGVIGQNAQLRTIKGSPIGNGTGRTIAAPGYTSGSPMLLTFTGTLPVGAGTSQALPLQNSIVASHRTAQIGRKGRGRMYLPSSVSAGMDTYGNLTSTRQDQVTAAQAALIEGCAFTGTGPDLFNVRPCVTGKPFINYGVINRVQCGSIPDTQQRRRNRETEVYRDHAVSY